MNIEEEVKDLQILVNQNEKVAKDFCQLSIESLTDEVKPKVYISAANKLGVKPIQIERVIHALLSIFFKATEKAFEREELAQALCEPNIPSPVSEAISEAYINNKSILVDRLEKLGIKDLQYKNLDWRFDILTRTRSLNEVVEPIVTLQLTLNEDAQTTQNHHLQVDPGTLVHMTESLEEAIQQARSHHIKKFKKQKKAS